MAKKYNTPAPPPQKFSLHSLTESRSAVIPDPVRTGEPEPEKQPEPVKKEETKHALSVTAAEEEIDLYDDDDDEEMARFGKKIRSFQHTDDFKRTIDMTKVNTSNIHKLRAIVGY